MFLSLVDTGLLIVLIILVVGLNVKFEEFTTALNITAEEIRKENDGK